MFDEPLCRCGRVANKVHCSQCGSAQVLCQTRKRDFVTRPDGTTANLRVFRCRVCGVLFNDDDWQLRCSASPPRTVAKPLAQRQAEREAKMVNRKIADLTQLVPNELQEELRKAVKMNEAWKAKHDHES